MGIAISALSDAYTLVEHNPIILGVGWVAAVFVTVANAVLGFVPLIGRIVSVFVWPLFLAGLLALIYSGRDGNAAAGDFVAGVGEHYLSLLGSTLLVAGVVFGLSFATAVAFVFVGMAGGIGGLAGGQMAGAMLLPLAILGVLMLVMGVLFQFYDVAIVAGGESALSAFARSFRVFTAAPLSVLGYTIARAAIWALFNVAPLVLLVVLATGLPSSGLAGGTARAGSAELVSILFLAVWALLLVPLGQVVTYTYHVAFFNRHSATVA